MVGIDAMNDSLFDAFDKFQMNRSEFLSNSDALNRSVDLSSVVAPLDIGGSEVQARVEYLLIRSLGTAVVVAKTIGKLYLMKTKADAADAEAKALEEIARKISEIESRLGNIENQLDEIRNELKGLAVKIDELPALAAVNVLRGRVDVIVDFIAAWTKDPNDPQIRPQITQNFVDVAQSVRTQMRHGYAHSLDVFIGFAFELELAFLLGYKSDDIEQSIARVIRYAGDLFNVGQSGSIGSVLAAINAEIKQLEKEDSEIDRRPIYLGTTTEDLCCVDGYRSIIDFYCQVNGNIKSGYTISSPNNYQFSYCSCNDGRQQSLNPATNFSQCSCGENYLQVQRGSVRQCPYNITDLNRKVARYDFLIQTKSTLEALRNQIDEIKFNIQARSKWQAEYEV